MTYFQSAISRSYRVFFLFFSIWLCLLTKVYGQTGWTLHSQEDFSYNLVQAVNEDTIYMSGTGSTTGQILLRTYDGFLSMDTLPIPSGSGQTFRFFDAQNAILSDQGQGIHVTTDAGVSWTQRSPTQLNGTIDKFAFCHPDTVYLGMDQGILYKTVDGGQNWSTISLPFLNIPNIGKSLETMEFSTSMVGYVSLKYNSTPQTTVLYKTIDGGQNWIDLNNTIGPTPGATLLVSHPDTLLLTCSNCPFLYSTDGAVSWDSLDPTHPIYRGYDSNDYAFHFKQDAISLESGGDVYRRKDNHLLKGNIWSLDSTEFDFPACSSINNMDVIGDDVIMLGYKSSIVKTSGGGTQSSQISLSERYRRSIHFMDSLTGLSLNSFYTRGISRTTDGGRTWKMNCLDISFSNEFAFWDDQKGLVTGANSSSVLMTSDGGLTWYNPIANNAVASNYASWGSSSHAYTISNNRMMKTVDGGSTWNRLPDIPDVNRSFGIHFTSQDTGHVVIERSSNNNTHVILRTEDGGQNWIQKHAINASLDGKIRSIHFPSKMVGYAVGYQNLTLKTTDGGNTWIKLNANPFPQDWLDVKFQNEMEGFRCGNRGIQLTQDGGLTWAFVLTGHGEISELTIPDLRHTYANSDQTVFTRDAGPVSAIPSVQVDAQESQPLSLLEIFPLPAQNELHMRADLKKGGPFSYMLRDIQGRTLRSFSGLFPNKNFRQTMSLEGIPDGIYFLTLEIGNLRTSRKVVVRK